MPGISYSIGLDAKAFISGMRRVMNATDSAKTAMISAGAAMASAFSGVGSALWKLPDQMRAITGIMSGLSLPAKLAGSAESTAVAFRVLLGDGQKAETLLGKIRTLANSTPFEFPELAGAARSLAAFGEDAQTIPDTLKRIGDIASGTQSDIGGLAQIYGKARVAGTLYAEDINQLLGRGIPVLQEFAKQTGRNEAAIKQLASEGNVTFPMLQEAFRSLTENGGKFGGMMSEIAGTFEGKLSTLGDSWNGLMTTLGKGLNEGLKPVMDELTRQLDGQQGLAKQIGESIGSGIQTGLQVIKEGIVGDVLGSQLKAAALEFSAAILEGLERAGDYIAQKLTGGTIDYVKAGLEEAGLAEFEWKGTAAAKPGAQWGSASVNAAAAEARDKATRIWGGVESRSKAPVEDAEMRKKLNADLTQKFGAKDAAVEAADTRVRQGAAGKGMFAAASPSSLELTKVSGGEYTLPVAKPEKPKSNQTAGHHNMMLNDGFSDGPQSFSFAPAAAPRPPSKRQNTAQFRAAHGDGGMRNQFSGLNSGWLYGRAPSGAALDAHTGRAQERVAKEGEAAGGQRKAEAADQGQQRRDAVLKKLLTEVSDIKNSLKNTRAPSQ